MDDTLRAGVSIQIRHAISKAEVWKIDDVVFGTTDAIIALVSSREAAMVEALVECKRLVECLEWFDVPAIVDAALAAVKEGK